MAIYYTRIEARPLPPPEELRDLGLVYICFQPANLFSTNYILAAKSCL